MAIRKTVYLGRDNAIVLSCTSVDADGNSTNIDFSGVYSILLELVGSGIAEAEYTSLGAGNIVDTSLGSGDLRLRLGTIVGLTAGSYKLRLSYKETVGDSAPTQIAHEKGPDVVTIVVVDA